MVEIAGLIGALSEALDATYLPGSPDLDTPVGRDISTAVLGRYRPDDGRYWERLRLSFLAKHLLEIREYDPSLLDLFRRKLRVPDRSHYFGVRSEIATAAKLIRDGERFDFELFGRADFVLKDREPVQIEATSAHSVDGEYSSNVLTKVGRAMVRKRNKTYCCPDTLLVVETTNLDAISFRRTGDIPSREAYDKAIQRYLFKAPFGGVIRSTFIATISEGAIRQVHTTHLAPRTSPSLRSFVNDHYAGHFRAETDDYTFLSQP